MLIHKEIQNALLSGNLVIFAGSGLSRRFDLPDWRKLVTDVIHEIEVDDYKPFIKLLETKSMSPIDVLTFIQSEHNKIHKYIKNNFDIKNGDFDLHAKLLELSGQIITTNYDNAFERAITPNIYPTNYDSDFNISQINKVDEPYILKLHGSFSEPDKCIVFKSQYETLYSNKEKSAIQKLKSIFTEKVILFIGFSFSDQELNLIFSSLDEAFGNNNRHYILTTAPTDFEKFRFISPIKINEHNEIEIFINACLDFKRNHLNKVELIETRHFKEETPLQKIAILYPSPLDINLNTDAENIISCFTNIEANIFRGVLNVKTLGLIDDYDILIIISKVFRSKIYVEEDNLKSHLLSVNEIYENVPNESIPIVLITDQIIPKFDDLRSINIASFKSSFINRFIFKTLRKGELNYAEDNIHVKISKWIVPPFQKGCARILSIYNGNPKNIQIDKKALDNIVGRIEEQASIALKLISIIKSNKFLNVKASGGLGKTSLTKKVALELFKRGYFTEGITFRSCEYIKTYLDFEEIIIQGFNLDNIVNFKEYLEDNYHSHKKDILIILDNFETVINSLDNKDLIRVVELLKFTTNFANITLTSRETIKLAEDFEDVYSLSALTTDDAQALFIQNYGEVTEQEIKLLRVEILEDLLNNNPLAIKLVTKSRTKFNHLNHLKLQLVEHFFESINEDYSSVFKDDADLNIERTKSLFQSINYSYTTLGDTEKLSFELLSLFPDGIGLANFKKCFEKNSSNNNISDKELRILRDKSLVDDDSGTLRLQPIIRRFADFQFLKRSPQIRQQYYQDAYNFNSYILNFLDILAWKTTSSNGHKAFSNVKNNLINVLNYIPEIDISDKTGVQKKYLLNYIFGIQSYIINEKHIEEFRGRLKTLGPYFADLPHAEILLKVLDSFSKYFFQEFDFAYSSLSEIYSVEDMEKRDFDNEDYIETRYRNIVSSIHCMEGNTLKVLKSRVENKNVKALLLADFFYLGIPYKIQGTSKGFYYYERKLIFETLNINELEDYINSLYQDEHLEIMQCTYTLSKVKRVDQSRLQKLVITNPYTFGLKELMYAFITENHDTKVKHFDKALKKLEHIKYYFLEALYYYCLYLKEGGFDFQQKLEMGLASSKELHYNYLYFLFNNIENNESKVYETDYSSYSIDNLEQFIKIHEEFWTKEFKRVDY